MQAAAAEHQRLTDSRSNTVDPVDRIDNPYRPPQTLSVARESTSRPGGRLDIVSIWLMLVTIVIGWPLSVIDVETIVGSGPVLTVLGLLVLARSVRTDRGWGMLFGLSGPCISFVCVAIINYFGWSPTDAQQPIPIILAAYALAAIPCGIAALYQCRARISAASSIVVAGDQRPPVENQDV